MDETDSTQPTAPTIPPEAVDQLFDDADAAAELAAIRRTLDAHRKEIVLMWLAIVLVSGVVTYQFARGLLADA